MIGVSEAGTERETERDRQTDKQKNMFGLSRAMSGVSERRREREGGGRKREIFYLTERARDRDL